VTKVDAAFEADRFFCDLGKSGRFELESSSEPVEENGIRYRFLRYVKIPPEGGRR
jgi:dihydrofolate reductase